MSTLLEVTPDGKNPASVESAGTAADRQSPSAIAGTSVREKIWIDLDNSPHVPFFKPIAEELERRGYSVVFTARDCFQVQELADLMKLNYRCIGHHYGKHTAAKLAGIVVRALQLLPYVLRRRPQLAVSHGSRSMFVLASMLRIPSITIMDYEHARWVWWLGNAWAMLPDVIPGNTLKLRNDRILRYPGIKEDVYAPFFRPDPAIKCILGLRDEELVVTLRPPATEAHYHNRESEVLLDAVFEMILQTPNVKVVLLPRTAKQEAELRTQWPGAFDSNTVIVPKQAVNGLDLIWFSDLVVSGGGTMNREAAALGVQVYSIFRGKTGAVDEYLAKSGRLVLLRSANEVRTKLKLVRRDINTRSEANNRETLATIVDHITRIVESSRKRSLALAGIATVHCDSSAPPETSLWQTHNR
jgi:predicted glycosyltransferase